jgi:Uma2 family endonuclease
MTLAPDWVCEVLSPSTRGIDRTRKLPIYHREGVAHAWLVEPRARTLEVFRREASGWLLTATHRDGDVVRAEPFDAVPLGLGALWLGGGGAQAERTP